MMESGYYWVKENKNSAWAPRVFHSEEKLFEVPVEVSNEVVMTYVYAKTVYNIGNRIYSPDEKYNLDNAIERLGGNLVKVKDFAYALQCILHKLLRG